ncbi:MAG TPA: calcium-binding protein, partial [Ilumatobacter sp.]|nr:calcium-binding protein [Ilumatobacter sp.]
QNGGDDTINGDEGRDLLIGGAGHDLADGDAQDDMVFGDNAFLDRTDRIVEGDFPTETDYDGVTNITSGRFQTLCGDLMYSRTDRPNACGNIVTADNSGQLLVNGVWRNYRDPDSPGVVDSHPWWAEYLVFFDLDVTDDDEFHTFDVDSGIKGADSWGNDYLAGGAHHDLVFGQMGDDVVMGDGNVEPAAAGEHHVGASRSPDGCPSADLGGDNYTHAGTCDLVGDLDVVPSFDSSTDGQDYLEGNGGNDTMLGNLGQDDIVGGSSDFFSLTLPYLRPDGADRIFGGSATSANRNDDGGTPAGLPVPLNEHGHDADSIVGDNGRIIRIVGTSGCDYLTGGCAGPAVKYVSYIYDDAYGEQIVVRGITLLDYTPGGPDFRPELFGLDIEGPCSDSASETQGGGCSELLPVGPRTNTWVFLGHRETAGNDEIHGERGDDTVYVGGGFDIVYGDSGDDDIVGGWGNDWISGGTGQDGILGDDGRIFTSRNSDKGYTAATNTTGTGGLVSKATNCTGDGAGDCFSEPLYGTTAFQPVGTCPENHSVLCGDYLDQYIATPGEVQTAVINIKGDLKKTVDLTPYNLQPSGMDDPKFDANNSDDVIFGGLGGERLPNYPLVIGHRNSEEPPFGQERGIAGDFLHGGAGDDAIAGGEAIWNGYAQLYNRETGALLPNAYRTDWTRPFNPGDLLHFGEDHDAWHDNGPIVTRLGEFALYDEYDPRRTIMLNANGTVNKDTNSGPNVVVWFLNLYSDEGPTMPGCVEYAPNGTCLQPNVARNSDGSDAIFGDEGNDWLVGGTGQDTL